MSTTTVNGKAVAEREDVVADKLRRYRAKRVTLDKLPASEYIAKFSLVAGDKAAAQELKFVVR